ncbi:HBL036Cp [Eremothecium sinecaudum]|uniref:HBL036Cp n=1 Tax=Eremothecium sinecaudum TaxID=45286 RepID=A0A109UWI1_9SACH|nr:HBL036Cp [Eremothecium sinecaudum]AMD18866.1 HBL036Cp [Eremothecium sinecaudum]
MFFKSKSVRESKQLDEGAIAAASAIGRALNSNGITLDPSRLPRHSSLTKDISRYSGVAVRPGNSMKGISIRKSMSMYAVHGNIRLEGSLRNRNKNTSAKLDGNDLDQFKTFGRFQSNSMAGKVVLRDSTSQGRQSEEEMVTKYVPGPRGLMKVTVAANNLSSPKQNRTSMVYTHNSPRGSLRKSVRKPILKGQSENCPSSTEAACPEKVSAEKTSTEKADTEMVVAKNFISANAIVEKGSTENTSVEKSTNKNSTGGDSEKVNSEATELLKSDAGNIINDNITRKPPPSRTLPESSSKTSSGEGYKEKESNTSVSFWTAVEDASDYVSHVTSDDYKEKKFETQVNKHKGGLPAILISTSTDVIDEVVSDDVNVRQTFENSDLSSNNVQYNEEKDEELNVAASNENRKEETSLSPMKSALKNNKSKKDPVTTADGVYNSLSPAEGAYLSLTTAENTRINARLSDERLTSSTLRNTTKRSPSVNFATPDSPKVKNIDGAVKVSQQQVMKSKRVSIIGDPGVHTNKKTGHRSSSTNTKRANTPAAPKSVHIEEPKEKSSFDKDRPKVASLGFKNMSLRAELSEETALQLNASVENLPTDGNETGPESYSAKQLLLSIAGGGWKSRFSDSDSDIEVQTNNTEDNNISDERAKEKSQLYNSNDPSSLKAKKLSDKRKPGIKTTLREVGEDIAEERSKKLGNRNSVLFKGTLRTKNASMGSITARNEKNPPAVGPNTVGAGTSTYYGSKIPPPMIISSQKVKGKTFGSKIKGLFGKKKKI